MSQRTPSVRIAQILLTITAIEFFGPILRDSGDSHVLNPTWVGHARVHLVWLLGFFFFSGISNLYLIWVRQPFDIRNLWLSVAWQSSNMGGFWIAYVLEHGYGGQIAVPGSHLHIFGWDENVFVFAILTAVLITAVAMLRRGEGEQAHAAH